MAGELLREWLEDSDLATLLRSLPLWRSGCARGCLSAAWRSSSGVRWVYSITVLRSACPKAICSATVDGLYGEGKMPADRVDPRSSHVLLV